jgi:hypothetical protein
MLEYRGYRTEFLVSLSDVSTSLEMINENEQELEGKPNIVLSFKDQLEILNICTDKMMDEVHCILNSTISHYILDHYDNPRYYEQK